MNDLPILNLSILAERYGMDVDELQRFLQQRQTEIIARAETLQKVHPLNAWKYEKENTLTILQPNTKTDIPYAWIIGPFAKEALDELLLVPGNGTAYRNLKQQNQILAHQNMRLIRLLLAMGALFGIVLLWLLSSLPLAVS